MIFRESDTTTQ